MELLAGAQAQTVLGGALIGIAAATLMILTGRVMAASGMIGSLLGGSEGPAAASIAFIAGLVIAPSVVIILGSVTAAPIEAHWLYLATGGLLVGFGARFGGASLCACIVGLALRSGRAVILALAIAAGAATSLLARQMLGSGGLA